MADNLHPTDSSDEFDPNAQTQDDATADKDWLKSNVNVRGDEWIGKTIGQFEIIRIIGTGGMGNVYEARQTHPKRAVALKIVKSAAATPATLQRFELESEMLARLQHPNIAQVYDSGHQQHDDTPLPFFAMEYVPGSKSIVDYVEQEHISRIGRLALFLRVCDAVQYGHGRGVIHRDLKPSNILITNSGRPKVIDFGVALMTGSDDPDHSLTKQGRFVGTLQWSSPEQCGDDPHDVDVRTDVYSIGMVLYHLMTNQLPYDLKGVAVYKAPQIIQETMPPPLQSIDNTIPIEIEHIVQKALKKERIERYESVAELSLDIRRFLNDQPIHAKPPTRMQRMRLYAKRNQLKFRAGLLVVIALMAGIAGLVWGYFESEARQEEMKDLLASESEARDTAEYKAYVATIGTVQAAIANESWKMARNHLDDAARKFRGWEWHLLKGVTDHSTKQWLIGDRPTSLAASAVSNTIAISFEGGRVLLIDEHSEIISDIQLQVNVRTVEFSNDGTICYLGLSNGQVGVVDVAGGALQFKDVSSSSIESIASFPTGGYAIGLANGDIQIFDEEHTLVTQWRTDNGMVIALDYLSEKYQLGIGFVNGTVQVMHLGESKLPTLLGSHNGVAHAVAFVSDGALVSGGADNKIKKWDVSSGLMMSEHESHQGDVMDIVAKDHLFLSADDKGEINIWIDAPVSHVGTLRGHDEMIWSLGALEHHFVSIGRDGAIRWWNTQGHEYDELYATGGMPTSDIAFVWNNVLAVTSEYSNQLQLINIATGDEALVSSDSKEALSLVEFVHTTSSVVTADVHGVIKLWDADSLKFTETIGDCKSQVSSLCVSPFGKYVIAGTFNGDLFIWDVRNNELVQQLHLSHGFPLAMTFGADKEAFYVSTSDGGVSAYQTSSGIALWNLIGNGIDVVAMGYEPTIACIITASASHVVQVLNASTGMLVDSSSASGSGLRDLVVFPDGKRFATVRSDGTIGVWSIDQLGLVAAIPSNETLEKITVSTDGHRVAVSGESDTILVLDGIAKTSRKTGTR